MKASVALQLVDKLIEDLRTIASQRAYDEVSLRCLSRAQVVRDIVEEAKQQAVKYGGHLKPRKKNR